jgi:subtilisin-like proprotein convertase family protein
MTIPQGAPGTTSGQAYPYPSRVYVPEEGVVPSKIRVQIWNLTHTFPDDLDMLLVSPTGTKFLLMSDAGGSTDVSNLSFVVDPNLVPLLPDSTALGPGEFGPANYDGGDLDSFPAPAPPGPYVAGTGLPERDPRGYWDLYVIDDAGSDVGSIGSWCIEILPEYAPGEVPNLRFPSKTRLEWDMAFNVNDYRVLRGTAASLPALLTADVDSCEVFDNPDQFALVLQDPAPEQLFWYLVAGHSGGTTPLGSAGTARLGGSTTARTADPGSCPP